MKRRKKTYLILLIIACLCISACIGKSSPTSDIVENSDMEEATDRGEFRYPPLLYINDRFYNETGEIIAELPEDSTYIGKTTSKESASKDLPHINFTSNILSEGTELYGNPDSLIYIYAKYISSEGDTMYSVFQSLDHSHYE